MLWFVKRAVFMSVIFVGVIVAAQDLLLFPGVGAAFYMSPPTAPMDMEPLQITTADGIRLEMWIHESRFHEENRRARPLVFLHGNGGNMASFVDTQRWLSSLGYQTYAIDMRGFGGSEGWPSERGLELDVEAAIVAAAQHAKVLVTEVSVAGLSVGTGLAAYAAAKYRLKTLILLSPYSNLRVRASEDPLLGFLSPLLKYDLPTSDYVAQLEKTCLVVAHGLQDRIIHARHADVVAQAYRGKYPLRFLRIPSSGHNDLVPLHHDRIAEEIRACIEATESL